MTEKPAAIVLLLVLVADLAKFRTSQFIRPALHFQRFREFIRIFAPKTFSLPPAIVLAEWEEITCLSSSTLDAMIPKPLSIRIVPTVPGVYAIRFLEATESILTRHFADGCWRYYQLGDSLGRRYCIERILAKFKDQYRKQFPTDLGLLENPQLVMENHIGEPDGFRIQKFGKKLVIAISPHFFAAFSTSSGRWIVHFVAVRPGEFIKVQLPGELRLTAVLGWEGRGIESTYIYDQRFLLPVTSLARHNLLQPRFAPDPIQLRRLYLSDGEVIAETCHHKFRLCEAARGPEWKVLGCGDDNIAENPICFYTGKPCIISGEERYMVIVTDEDEEQQDGSESQDKDDEDSDIVNDNVFLF